MKSHLIVMGGAALLVVSLASLLPINDQSDTHRTLNESTIGDVQAFETLFKRWAAARSRAGDSKSLKIVLGYSKALSARFTRAQGLAQIDLIDGSVSIEVSGLADDAAYDVWLIDNRTGPGLSVRPEAGDEMLHLGSLHSSADGAKLSTGLAAQDLVGFEIDLVVVGEHGRHPGSAGLLYGSPSLLQKLFHRDRDGWYASLAGGNSDPDHLARAPLDFLVPRAIARDSALDISALVRRGERVFFNEQFEGNGRTCGTCHPAENNFTIDPAFIATLSPKDPLFVAEFDRNLATLERPKLMREFGLILENLDGFDALGKKFTLRGVPHTLALPTSLVPSDDGTTIPPIDRTGWSGDGAPGSGTLREFATGAVIQHFPRTLNRKAGKDFRLPTERELDALEAFQLSLGRQQDIDLAAVKFLDDRVARGKEIFLNQEPNTPGAGQCNRCHADAGANINFADLGNRNFNTGAELLTDRTARRVAPGTFVPCDGGFGTEENADPDPICSRVGINFVAFGDGTFNTPTLIEAADTPPFFHNNSVDTIEDAVLFYNGPEFNDSGIGQTIGGIRLTTTEILEVAAMLRVLNSVENIRTAIRSERRALVPGIVPEAAVELLRNALEENRDALRVLRESVLSELHPDASDLLSLAERRLREAIKAPSVEQRNRLILKAIDLQETARDYMARGIPG